MSRWSRAAVLVALVISQFFAGVPAHAAPTGVPAHATPTGVPAHAPAGVPAAADSLTERLEAAGLRIVSERPVGQYRFFLLTFTQPVDHAHPARGSFEQRLSLLHRAEDRPMVLHTTGYGLWENPFRDEPTRLVDGNQISVEQRFFTPSRPQPADWSKLNIWQAATDHHRLVQALKPIYGAKWLSTGASKGGMTSVYHRRFYPRDVDGTIAYVAPNDVINSHDRYGAFLEKVGTDPACRDALVAMQREALKRRGELVRRMEVAAKAEGLTHTQLGGADRAFEYLVIDARFAFWQYSLQSDCPKVPAPTASDDELYAFLDEVAGFSFYSDQGIEGFVPYYYQAGTQLGGPIGYDTHLGDLLRYPGAGTPRDLVPDEIPMRFQPLAMFEIDTWVKLAGQRLLFVYGENDPWSAEIFAPGPGTRDSFWYTVKGGNHGSKIGLLPDAERTAATATVRRWADVTPPAATLRATSALDNVDVQPRVPRF